MAADTSGKPAYQELPTTAQLLVDGGDARIALAPDGLNKYGNAPFPDLGIVALGSSTSSNISPASFVAADCLRDKLIEAMKTDSSIAVYTRELNQLRLELADLCEVSDITGVELVFAASGTDVHLIASQLVSSKYSLPTLAIMVEAAESGSGVPSALTGQHFSNRTALGASVVANMSIKHDNLDGKEPLVVATVAIRQTDGTPRPPAEVDAEFTALAVKAVAQGQHVLLVLCDVSKTGLIAPNPACALALLKSFPNNINVLVDACQFRISPTTLRAYLQRGFMVALTGSKFITGPSFSGVLLIPSHAAKRLRRQRLPHSISAYSSAADWTSNWDTNKLSADAVNFGLLLRWEAAMVELRALRAISEPAVELFLRQFEHMLRERLTADPMFEWLPVYELDRHLLDEESGWDRVQTIFPFLLLHPETHIPLDRVQTRKVYQLLQLDLTGQHTISFGKLASVRFQLGQPVECGIRHGVPLSALRLCVSARMVIEATTSGTLTAATVIERVLLVFDKIVCLMRSGQI